MRTQARSWFVFVDGWQAHFEHNCSLCGARWFMLSVQRYVFLSLPSACLYVRASLCANNAYPHLRSLISGRLPSWAEVRGGGCGGGTRAKCEVPFSTTATTSTQLLLSTTATLPLGAYTTMTVVSVRVRMCLCVWFAPVCPPVPLLSGCGALAARACIHRQQRRRRRP